ncbi:uncharacterized protein LOC107040768 [Diachasma alloeum]|uniref:uncharacterized protein LOC107040768 n=1 Tax=Diachasma alloeum TaxID=454923 RepID=UPI0007382AB5|nr:uncharacterized protein LOC107040768 [Diachasma alloeum]
MGLSWTLQQRDLVLVLVLVMTVAGEPLTGAVCHRVENYTTTVRESYQEPVQVQITSWCFSVPPRCSRTRTEWRTRYTTKEEVRQRDVSECCEGYARQKLVVNGSHVEKCVATLDCKPGFIGKHCDIECPEGTWGILCRHVCKCGTSKACNRITGRCECPEGWKGSNCTEPCETGKYGLNCSLDCPCGHLNGNCHHVTGNCLDSVSITPEMSNWTQPGLEASTTAPPPPTTATASSMMKNTRVDDFPDSTTMKPHNSETSNSRNEIALDSTVETTIITEYHEVHLPETEESTVRPIVAVVHVGKAPSNREKIVVAPNMGPDHISGHTVPLTLDVAVAVVIGSIISLGLTTLAVLAILHVRTKLFETIRLSIYDAEKPDPTSATLPREKGSTGITTINRSGTLTPCDYETPRCIVPQGSRTLPRPSSVMTRESTYSNQYPNIQLFNSLRELMEAHYDRPPAANTFRQAPGDAEAEHLYDEIPLQSINFGENKHDLLK